MKEVLMDYKLAAKTLNQKVIADNPDVVAAALKSIVSSEGAEVYRDIPKVAQMLKERGIKDKEIKQVELTLYGSSFSRYLEQLDSGLSAIDINNIILTAERAGLSPEVARKTVSAILFSLNIAQLAQDLTAEKLAENAESGAIYIPVSAYKNRLNSFRRMLQKNVELSEDEFSELNAFARAGISEAQTLLGRLYLQGVGVPADKEIAVKYLKEAAAHGDAEAYGLLGDYYYGTDNKQAFALYSGPGALALNEERWERFRNLYKVKKFNNLQALLLLALAVLIEVFMFAFHQSVFTGGHMAAGIVCSVINCIAAAGILVVHFKDPYQDLRNLSLPFLATFFVFAQILI